MVLSEMQVHYFHNKLRIFEGVGNNFLFRSPLLKLMLLVFANVPKGNNSFWGQRNSTHEEMSILETRGENISAEMVTLNS